MVTLLSPKRPNFPPGFARVLLVLFGSTGGLTWIAAAADAEVRVELIQAGTNFTYTVHNDLAGASVQHVNAWHLQLNAPFQVLSAPAGWTHVTDNVSYIDWISTSELPPYGDDIAPGATLGGFALASITDTSEVMPYGATSWDHAANKAGPCHYGVISAPSVTSVLPQLVNLTWSQTTKVFQCTVLGVPKLQYAIEKSTDLITWNQVISKASPFTFADTILGDGQPRYFRAVYVDSFGVADAPPGATEDSGP